MCPLGLWTVPCRAGEKLMGTSRECSGLRQLHIWCPHLCSTDPRAAATPLPQQPCSPGDEGLPGGGKPPQMPGPGAGHLPYCLSWHPSSSPERWGRAPHFTNQETEASGLQELSLCLGLSDITLWVLGFQAEAQPGLCRRTWELREKSFPWWPCWS